jgi:hypothetical protein
MPVFQTPPISDNPLVRDLGHEDLTASWGEWAGAIAKRALYDSPAWSAVRLEELAGSRGVPAELFSDFGDFYNEPQTTSPQLSPEDWKQSPYFRTGLSFPAGVKESVAKTVAERYDYRKRLDDIADRHPKSLLRLPAELAVTLGASMLDPLNLAAAFVPVVGEARYASMMAKVGKWPARLATGALEGTVGMGLVEPVVAAARIQEQADYTFLDSLVNIAFGGIFGAGLHGIAGGAKDLWARFSPSTREALVRTAVSQAFDGRHVDVKPLAALADSLETSRELKPWQMTREEFHAYWYEEKTSISREDVEGFKLEADNARREIVTRALEHGKPVPEWVLKDFPDVFEAVSLDQQRKAILAESQEAAWSSFEYISQVGISKKSVVTDYGIEGVSQLNRSIPGVVRDGGIALDILAADEGFGTGDDLFNAIINRKTKKQLAEELGDADLFSRTFGDETHTTDDPASIRLADEAEKSAKDTGTIEHATELKDDATTRVEALRDKGVLSDADESLLDEADQMMKMAEDKNRIIDAISDCIIRTGEPDEAPF